MRRWLTLIVTCFSISFLMSQQGVSVNQGAKSYSLGSITTVLGGSDALFNNFSGIIDSTDFNVLLASSNRFGLSELTSFGIGLHKKVNKLGHFGLTLTDYGFESYSDQNIALKYAKALSSKFNISGELGLNRLTIPEYGSTTNFIYKIGMRVELNEDLTFGMLLSNPEKVSIDIDDTSQIVSALSIGLKYSVSLKAQIFAEISKELEENFDFRFGIQYFVHPKFILRAGYSSVNGQSGGGISYKIAKALIVDTSIRYHSLLGVSPAISLKYTLHNKD